VAVGNADNPALLTVVATTGSTNDDVMGLGRGTAPHGSAVAAREQSAGRGRRGHEWKSPDSGVYLSVLLRPHVPMQLYMGLPVVCALGVLDALRGCGADGVSLKWPNDIVVGAVGGCVPDTPSQDGAACEEVAKLGGILVEAGTGEAGLFAVCGIGINLAAPGELPTDSHRAVALPPVGLDAVMPAGTVAPGFDELAESLRAGIVARVDAWEQALLAAGRVTGPLAPVLDEYVDDLAWMGHAVAATSEDGQELCRGILAGMDVWGRVTIRDAFGGEHELSSEMATLRPLPESERA
jgi:BirA family biotin operon repressor/biotin-[acetyl-CoA-carboxylase] ligase